MKRSPTLHLLRTEVRQDRTEQSTTTTREMSKIIIADDEEYENTKESSKLQRRSTILYIARGTHAEHA
jgi:hypothetical protein